MTANPDEASESTTTDISRFQVLSLDGGGIKGLFSAAILAALEEDLGINVCDHFDLLAGTSTGGIIALGLATGLRARQLVDFYLEEGPKIFRPRGFLSALRALFTRKYSQKYLRDALKKYFQETTLAQCQKRVVVPSFSLSENDVYLFRTAHHKELRRDYRVAVWKVALATSAAPTYFPVCTDVASARLIDGGVWANNPAMVGLVEAVHRFNCPLPNIAICSVGTSEAVPRRSPRLNSAGLLGWGVSGAAVDVIMRGQSAGVSNQVRLLVGEQRFLRIDAIVADGEFSLDGTESADALVAKAAHISRKVSQDFASKFTSHTAPRFTSIYQ